MQRIKHWTTRLTALIITLVSVAACAQQEAGDTAQTETIREMNVSEAYQFIQDNPAVMVIDVRTDGEYTGELGHIAGSLLRPVQEIESWAPRITDHKDADIVLVCRSGNRSGRAAQYLQAQGFQRLINVSGGMRAWNAAGLPVEKGK